MRLFLAMPIPAETRAILGSLPRDLPRARWVRMEQLHFTLRFLGERDAEIVDALSEALGPTVAAHPALEMRASGLGTFGRRVLWAGLAPVEGLTALARDVGAALREVGVEAPDRPFAPHVTLARLGGSAGLGAFLEAHGGWRGPLEVWGEVTLMRSELGSRGATHTVLRRFPLSTG
ncbi:MAG TPA: RNA 2',3'-cyclic phosphodiesterase [Myxococcales bacterium]|nr:RNA 2',3'-cyclic phosphodiesterase [Myxococcales bacterium]